MSTQWHICWLYTMAVRLAFCTPSLFPMLFAIVCIFHQEIHVEIRRNSCAPYIRPRCIKATSKVPFQCYLKMFEFRRSWQQMNYPMPINEYHNEVHMTYRFDTNSSHSQMISSTLSTAAIWTPYTAYKYHIRCNTVSKMKITEMNSMEFCTEYMARLCFGLALNCWIPMFACAPIEILHLEERKKNWIRFSPFFKIQDISVKTISPNTTTHPLLFKPIEKIHPDEYILFVV